MKVLNIGVSKRSICGVHDYAAGLAEELRSLGNDIDTRWCVTGNRPRRAFGWIRSLAESPEIRSFDVILWHYSAFSYGANGIPFLVLPLFAQLRRTSIPVVVVLHEYAYPWHQTGWRGTIWAIAQRLALIPVVWSACGLVVTVKERARWLERRLWLPHRPVLSVPVFSNLPKLEKPPVSSTGGPRIGMFGYRPSEAQLIVAALAVVKKQVPTVELWMLGSPGADTEWGSVWRDTAAAAGAGTALRFTGSLRSEDLVRAINQCDVSVFHDGGGPSSRKTTLAALLAEGVPVVAVDGPNTWQLLVREGAVRLVNAAPGAIAATLTELVRDRKMRDELGRRGKDFYRRNQDRRRIADEIASFVRELV